MSRASPSPSIRRVCFVTGTRAEYGLMRSVLAAIEAHPGLRLQVIATGMHLDRSRGRSLDVIRAERKVDAVVPWSSGDGSRLASAIATGKATAGVAQKLEALKTDIVLVTGDRVEAFAAASAAHLSGRLLAHVHGGDRALGLVDDALRHTITKLAHVHFPATAQSADRIERLGEDPRRIFRVGSPALDGVRRAAASQAELLFRFPSLQSRRFALLVLHPQSSDVDEQRQLARTLLRAVKRSGFPQIVIIYPNNDPGSQGIVRSWEELAPNDSLIVERDVPRDVYLGLLREAAALVGNSSSGIIEAASFATPVLDVGMRQSGRERGDNVMHAGTGPGELLRQLGRIRKAERPARSTPHNPYGDGKAGPSIANVLGRIALPRFMSKLIAY